jgi:hypothetical protein
VLAPPSCRSQSEPLPFGAVPQVEVGAPTPVAIVTAPRVMVAIPVPCTEICGLDPLEAGGVPDVVESYESSNPNPGPVPLASKPWLGPPAVR